MHSYKITLKEWQNTLKPQRDLIVQASHDTIGDGLTDSSIGMSHAYLDIESQKQEQFQIGIHSNLLLLCLRNFTDHARRKHSQINRDSILSTLESNGFRNTLMNSITYFKSLSQYKFIASPEGNGIDCHRHYEALIAGCIPIVEEGNKEILIKKYGQVPFLFTHDYSEITEEYLVKQYNEMIDKVYDFGKLFLSSWNIEEQENIKRRGNYWCRICKNRKWY